VAGLELPEVTGDTLWLSVAEPNAEAPTDFRGKANQCVFTLKRAEKSGGRR
jgi:hypothetical protein